MNIYLPIAEVSVNVFVLLGLGGGVGVLSGLFGVGGGFLITPLLIFVGIPPAVAVATGTNQVAAASFSGVLTHWRRRTVDLKMGLVLLGGGLVGSAIGVQLFAWLRRLGQVEIFVSLCYVVFLGVVGALMLAESVRARRRTRRGTARRVRRHHWVHGLPFKMRFRQSNLYISAIPPVVVGMLVGVLAAIMGVGGGFIMVPAMIYILGMATSVVVGTSLFQILFVAAFTTMMHAILNQTVDALLAIVLIVGGVLGAQVGARLSPRLRAEELRIALSVLVLLVCLKLAFDLVQRPAELYNLSAVQ
ncbi:sulfite exporter TauE/SafE family protein [Limibaculum sp. M0105]|uniref:Probable membrane transporter protein n=1 Tax=Thermohalobaculum xanthum TaxID=2753746 RepID=A0A8J7M7X6_9RHOB|nr:sulfite exporter TauE/SafE family protein [Thermohalobaculum xanthum]MBK0399318.1 sulfite exporter TauE/SafE family protein [Thermohalobaculum xanthum]